MRATKFIVGFAAKQLLSDIFHCPLPCSNASLRNMKGNSHLQELLWQWMLRQGWIRSKSPSARTKGQGMLSLITKALQQLLRSSLQNPHESQMLAFHPVVLWQKLPGFTAKHSTNRAAVPGFPKGAPSLENSWTSPDVLVWVSKESIELGWPW